MIERFRAYLIDWDKLASLDNLDFDSFLYLRRTQDKGFSFEFEDYDWRDGSVEVAVESPDKPRVLLPESPEEWERKRQWYLEYSANCAKTLAEGLALGYLNDEHAEWMSFPNALDIMEDDILQRQLFEQDLEYLLQERETTKIKTRKRSLNPRRFLSGKRDATDLIAEKAKMFRERILAGNSWRIEDFTGIGFELPDFSNKAQEADYILETLKTFVKEVDKKNQRNPHKTLRRLLKTSGLEKSLIQDAKTNPWQVYNLLDENYSRLADSSQEYNQRVDEVVFALRL